MIRTGANGVGELPRAKQWRKTPYPAEAGHPAWWWVPTVGVGGLWTFRARKKSPPPPHPPKERKEQGITMSVEDRSRGSSEAFIHKIWVLERLRSPWCWATFQIFLRSFQGFPCGPSLYSVFYFKAWCCGSASMQPLMEPVDDTVGLLLPGGAMEFCSPREKLAAW